MTYTQRIVLNDPSWDYPTNDHQAPHPGGGGGNDPYTPPAGPGGNEPPTNPPAITVLSDSTKTKYLVIALITIVVLYFLFK